MKLRFGRGGLEGSARIFKSSKRLRVDTDTHLTHQEGDEEGREATPRPADDWASPFPDDPNESVRVIKKPRVAEPVPPTPSVPPEERAGEASEALEGGFDEYLTPAEQPAPDQLAAVRESTERFDAGAAPADAATGAQAGAGSAAHEDAPGAGQGAPVAGRPAAPGGFVAPASSAPQAESHVSKYGGKFANIGRVSSTSWGQPSGQGHRASQGDAARTRRPYDARRRNEPYSGFARRLDESKAEERAEQAAQAEPEPAGEELVPIPAHDHLTPQEYDNSVRWQERFGTEVAIYRSNLIAASAHHVADVGCGDGRLTLHLAQWGFDVAGIDPDADMIAVANQLAQESAESIEHAQGSVEFKQGALGDLVSLFGQGSLDGVLCVGDVLTSLGSIDELRRALLDFNEAIAPDGVLVASFVNYRKLTYERRRSNQAKIVETPEATRLFLDLYDYPAGGTHVDVERLIGKRGPDGTWNMGSVRSRHLIITSDTLSRELVDAGFDVIETAGSYDGSRTSPLESDSVVVVARRRRRTRPVSYR